MSALSIAEQNKELVRRMVAALSSAFSSGSVDELDHLFRPDFVNHQPGSSRDFASLKRALAGARAAYSDPQLTIDHMVAEGDLVAQHLTFRATQKGSSGAMAPPGEPVTICSCEILRIVDGKVAERWGVTATDQPGLREQTRAIPASEDLPHDGHAAAVSGFIRVPGEAPAVQALGETAILPAEGAATGGRLAAHEVVVPPGAANPPHVHRTYDEALYVLAGEVRMVVGDRAVAAPAGSFGYAPRGTAHGVQNPGLAPASVLTLSLPADDIRALVDEINALPPGQPDIAQIGALLLKHDIHPAGPLPAQSST